jgi:SAM-dependent methyltransferase
MTYREIAERIESTLDIRERERDRYAEVNTPLVLIEEVLDNLPARVWKSPDLVWLDPCAGSGNFFLVVYHRLNRGIAHAIPDADLRHLHIIRNMLVMAEINPDNAKALAEIFGGDANIHTADFLEWRGGDAAEKGRFDVIVGNPPYNYPKTAGKYPGSAGNKTLWNKFVVESMRILADGGALGFITPSNWRRPEHAIYGLLAVENHLAFLHIYGKPRGHELFGVQTRFDVYVVSKTGEAKNTRIIDELGDEHAGINAKEWSFLPNFCFEVIGGIAVRETDSAERADIVFHSSCYDARKLKHAKSGAFRFPVIHTVNKEGVGILYSDANDRHFGIKKVVLNMNEKLYPINDFRGEYGMSQLNFGIRIDTKKEGDSVVRALGSATFADIIRATKWNSFQTDYRFFKRLKRYFYRDPVFKSAVSRCRSRDRTVTKKNARGGGARANATRPRTLKRK